MTQPVDHDTGGHLSRWLDAYDPRRTLAVHLPVKVVRCGVAWTLTDTQGVSRLADRFMLARVLIFQNVQTPTTLGDFTFQGILKGSGMGVAWDTPAHLPGKLGIVGGRLCTTICRPPKPLSGFACGLFDGADVTYAYAYGASSAIRLDPPSETRVKAVQDAVGFGRRAPTGLLADADPVGGAGPAVPCDRPPGVARVTPPISAWPETPRAAAVRAPVVLEWPLGIQRVFDLVRRGVTVGGMEVPENPGLDPVPPAAAAPE